jgi:preprotein translocase subunit SecE
VRAAGDGAEAPPSKACARRLTRSADPSLGTPRPPPEEPPTYDETVGRNAAVALYVLALVAVVVGVDVLFFKHHFWERLMANIGIVLVFVAFYLRFRLAPGSK